MTADPAVIAASLGKRERDVLLQMTETNDLCEGSWALDVNGLCHPEFSAVGYKGDRITPLGRAVAAVIRERG